MRNFRVPHCDLRLSQDSRKQMRWRCWSQPIYLFLFWSWRMVLYQESIDLFDNRPCCILRVAYYRSNSYSIAYPWSQRDLQQGKRNSGGHIPISFFQSEARSKEGSWLCKQLQSCSWDSGWQRWRGWTWSHSPTWTQEKGSQEQLWVILWRLRRRWREGGLAINNPRWRIFH